MGLLSWIIIGLLVGLAIRYFFSGPVVGLPVNLLMTVTGSLTGGYVSCYFSNSTLAASDMKTMLAALCGALIMAVLLRILRI